MSAENRSSRPLSPWILGVTVACLATVSAASEPTQLPALEPTTIDVDVTSLPASEKAALARIVDAGRLMDALYIRQGWPGTAGLMNERETAQKPSAQAELTALNFFKGPWDAHGASFISGVPPKRPIGDFYPADATKAELDSWLASLAAPDRAQALDSFTVIRRAPDRKFEVSRYSHHYARELTLAAGDLRAAANLTRADACRSGLWIAERPARAECRRCTNSHVPQHPESAIPDYLPANRRRGSHEF
jgi:hypothetical protein